MTTNPSGGFVLIALVIVAIVLARLLLKRD